MAGTNPPTDPYQATLRLLSEPDEETLTALAADPNFAGAVASELSRIMQAQADRERRRNEAFEAEAPHRYSVKGASIGFVDVERSVWALLGLPGVDARRLLAVAFGLFDQTGRRRKRGTVVERRQGLLSSDEWKHMFRLLLELLPDALSGALSTLDEPNRSLVVDVLLGRTDIALSLASEDPDRARSLGSDIAHVLGDSPPRYFSWRDVQDAVLPFLELPGIAESPMAEALIWNWLEEPDVRGLSPGLRRLIATNATFTLAPSLRKSSGPQRELVERALVGDLVALEKEADRDPQTASDLAEALALYFEDRVATAKSAAATSELLTWVDAESLIVGLVSQPEVDRRRLMEATLTNIDHVYRRNPRTMSDALLRAFIEHVPDLVAAQLPRRTEFGFIVCPMLWSLDGPEGDEWLSRLWDANPRKAMDLWSKMGKRMIGSPTPWRAEDAPDRLDVIATKLTPEDARRPLPIANRAVPRNAMPALIRVVRAVSGEFGSVTPDDYPIKLAIKSLMRVAENSAEADAALFDWEMAADRPDVLSGLLAHFGADRAEAIIRIAEGEGRIDAETATVLIAGSANAPVEPQWRVTGPIDVGHIGLPSGLLAACDPFWPDYGGLTIDVPPGTYEVRMIEAVHDYGEVAYCAAELHLITDAVPKRWERIPESYTPEVGVGSYGAPEVTKGFLQRNDLVDRVGDLPGQSAPFHMRVESSDGDAVFFSVSPQHATCVAWIGRSEAGAAVRVVTDLGILNLDLENEPRLPW